MSALKFLQNWDYLIRMPNFYKTNPGEKALISGMWPDTDCTTYLRRSQKTSKTVKNSESKNHLRLTLTLKWSHLWHLDFQQPPSFDACFEQWQPQAQLFPSFRNRQVFSGKMPCQNQYYLPYFLILSQLNWKNINTGRNTRLKVWKADRFYLKPTTLCIKDTSYHVEFAYNKQNSGFRIYCTRP